MPATYTQDIRPLFRDKDITCMTRRSIRLGEADWMCASDATFGFPDHGNARRVFEMVADGSMPPDGAWTQGQLDTYQRWMNDGFQQ